MRFVRRRGAGPEPLRLPHGGDARLLAYREGFLHGLEETLDQLQGRSTLAPDGSYTGPLPDELRAWLDAVRARVDGQRNGSAASP